MFYIEAIIGGLLIGFAAALLLWSLGRVAGISGILWQASFAKVDETGAKIWRGLFLLGLILGPLVLHLLGLHVAPAPSDQPWLIIALAGLLVGFGTRLGSGCTSGHGICGIARFSMRSIVATLTFMAAGIITVTFTRHILGA